ncbi:Filamentous haemagglutinin family outer membrane protein associated with VreARI signalling system [plant metagenome]|uniref:Filamentous haemagglutinin family outer membrane protein associated with VreARI signalling system n=1 Tax=plant metagenome TaxID=1297885 RepID=A0A484PLX2_9ZZZZ
MARSRAAGEQALLPEQPRRFYEFFVTFVPVGRWPFVCLASGKRGLQHRKTIMENQTQASMRQAAGRTGTRTQRAFQPTPLMRALAAVLYVAGSVAVPEVAQAAPNWFAAGQSAGQQARSQQRGPMPGMASPTALRQQMEARQQLTKSIANLNRTANAIAAQQASQEAARAWAGNVPSSVPDGLAAGGLEVATGTKAGWAGAEGPVASADGRTVVIKQTAERAILNWESFNVGRNTTLKFDQKATDAVLNKVVGASTAPSQIQGRIEAAGTVMVVNQNGVVFSGTSQVNVRNLVAAAAAPDAALDAQFLARGLYSDGTTPAFKDALGNVVLQPGARITTHPPTSATQGGGYVLLAGKNVQNAGTIHAPRGQALLAAGDSFVIARGQGTEGNVASTTRGNEVTVGGVGSVSNTGLIQSPLGDIRLAGNQVVQGGMLAASTSVDTRGTIYLKATGADGLVTLKEAAVNAILVDTDGATALEGQRESFLAPAVPIAGANRPAWQVADPYRRDLSLVQVDSSGAVDFQSGSLTLATGGQVAVKATGRTLLRDGAEIDVAGAIGVSVAMETNNLKINIQGNEQRDAPVNRDGGKLNSSDVWLDVRDLVYVPAGTGDNENARWYTAGGLLEVGGYLGTRAVPVSHWLAQGGMVRFEGGEVVTQGGSSINLSGGTLDVQDGTLRQTWLKGSDGRLYTADRAPGDLLYDGIYRGYEVTSARWGQTRRYYDAMMAPTSRKEAGYTVGRDAGALIVSTKNAVLEGQLVGDTYQGARQTGAPQAGVDGYQQSHNAQARGGQLVVGSYLPFYGLANKELRYVLSASANTVQEVLLGNKPDRIAQGIDLTEALPEDRQGKLILDTTQLNGFNLGAIRIAAQGGVTVDAALSTTNGGEITLYGPSIDINADLISRAGAINVGNVQNAPNAGRLEDIALAALGGKPVHLNVAEGVRLDARGLWTNQFQDPSDIENAAYRNGGRVSLRGTGNVNVAEGSVIDVSSGGVLTQKGALQGGKGGSVTLAANAMNTSFASQGGQLSMAGSLRASGVTGGGTLSVTNGGAIVLGGAQQAARDANALWLAPEIFQAGFGQYTVNGHEGVTVADGATIDVVMPVYRKTLEASAMPASGVSPDMALSLWTPPLYQEDPGNAVLTQRAGASIALHSDRNNAGKPIEIKEGATVTVDPGQAITLRGADQMTVLGSLIAPGGTISIDDLRFATTPYTPTANARSVWIGERALLDVAGRSHVARDRTGARYGIVHAGGSIDIGGTLNWETGQLIELGERYMDRHLIIRPGALLEASGTQAVLDLPGRGAITVASSGGSIVLASANSLHLDGAIRAASGGAGAAGGTLALALANPFYRYDSRTPEVDRARFVTLAQIQRDSVLAATLRPGDADAGLVYGEGHLGVDRVVAGGFGSLALFATLQAVESIDLSMPESLRLAAQLLPPSNAPAAISINLAAPYVLLDAAAFRPETSGVTGEPPILTVPWQRQGHQIRITADHIDVRGNRGLAFDDVVLESRGDLRMRAGVSDVSTDFAGLGGALRVTISAAQIYPETGVRATISAGSSASANGDGKLTLRRSQEGALPPVPHSAFGSLELSAPTVEQGGVVRAPMGRILFGSFQNGNQSLAVHFLPGSLTSVSGAGLIMPYGGTVDDWTYLYGGQKPQQTEAGRPATNYFNEREIGVQVHTLTIAPGAVLDLSGGGELTGAGFVNGRGGSVDILKQAMADSNPANGFSRSGNAVYAILPTYAAAYAPIVPAAEARAPAIGQQISLANGMPGLPAGTYTLLPASYALLPGAFRVEIGAASVNAGGALAQMRSGSWATTGFLGTSNTGQRNALANSVLLTPADVVRRHSQYNETSYSEFLLAEASRSGRVRALLPMDASRLMLQLYNGAGMSEDKPVLVQGDIRLAAAPGSAGFGGNLFVSGSGGLEVLGAGQSPSGKTATAVSAEMLNAIGAKRMSVSASAAGPSTVDTLLIRSGATLRAPEILLSAGDRSGVVVEQGATLSTLGMGPASLDASQGYYYEPTSGVLLLSNGVFGVLPPPSTTLTPSLTPFDIGACVTECAGTTQLLSEGMISVATNGTFTLGDNVSYGTRNFTLSMASVHMGTGQTLAEVAAAGLLSPGLALNQDVLGRLLRGNTAVGTPALESLVLSAGESVNVFGNVDFDTRGAGGVSSLRRLVLSTPAIYGYGAAGDVATISTGEFVWAGSLAADRSQQPVLGDTTPAAPGGAILNRLGDGRLVVAADAIRFDAAPYAMPTSLIPSQRLMLGFASVTLEAAQQIVASGAGSLAVHQKVDGYTTGQGWQYRGGDLVLRTPLLTSRAGATLNVQASGALAVQGTGATPGSSHALGGSLSLAAQRIALDTTVALPSGKLTLAAQQDIVLGDAARIDLAGREVSMHDVKRYSWGGDLVMKSAEGNITQAAGSVIDLSARFNRGGRLEATALGASAGAMRLAGTILGSASGLYDAGGTYVPYDTAEITLRAQTLADFIGLNARLNQGQVFGARRFQVKQGDLTVGDEVRARHVEIVADGGNLTVNGKIDASGAQVGSILLAAQGNLTINGLLDAHGTHLRRDSYGKIIDSPNRAIIDLTSRQGTLTLTGNAAFDLRAGTEQSALHDGVARGTLDLNVRRTGGGSERGALAGSGDGANGVALDVMGTPEIQGAKLVAVNAFRRYTDAPLAAQPDVTGKTPQLISQDYFDGVGGIHAQNQAFMALAQNNATLSNTLTRLGARLRPGVEIASATADGDLTLVGDLDLSGYRYGPNVDAARRGFGEPGVLVVRAGGNLNLHGSINDGFAPPPDTPDDDGWLLIEGRYNASTGQTPFGGDLVIPIDGVTLDRGTIFPAGRALNYDLPALAATLPAGTELPMSMVLAGTLTLPAGLVLTSDVTTQDGRVLAAGTVLDAPLALGSGARLGAGFRLRSNAAMQAFTWPKGVKLPVALTASAPILLARGALIPSQTTIELPGNAPVNLRPVGPGGKQGRNWALAPMLESGATSWDITLVAGADLGSADVRARNTLGTGDIVLADTHYGKLSTFTYRFEGSGGPRFTQAGADAAFASDIVGMTAAEADAYMLAEYGMDLLSWSGMTFEQVCALSAGNCVTPPPAGPRLTQAGADAAFASDIVGMTAAEADAYMLREYGMDLVSWSGLTFDAICLASPANCLPGEDDGEEPKKVYEYEYKYGTPVFSVLRTGVGDLSLLAGRDVGMASVYGVYTAGTPTSLGSLDARYNLALGGTTADQGWLGDYQDSGFGVAAAEVYRAWYPDFGGNLVVAAGRDIHGDVWGDNAQNGVSYPDQEFSRYASNAVGNWLWRQGNRDTPGVAPIDTSWWINFGTYVNNSVRPEGQPRLVGFTGFGTLGGGNLSLVAGRDAGVTDARGDALVPRSYSTPRSQGLVAAVGGTGRVVGDELVLTGGGDLDLRVGTALNPGMRATQQQSRGDNELLGGTMDHLDLNGVLTNLRGSLTLSTGKVGGISLAYGDGAGLRQSDPFAVGGGRAMGGLVMMLGDATAWLDTRGDLVLGGVSDPGRTRLPISSPYHLTGEDNAHAGGGMNWFSLWTPATAVNLFSAGGNLVPITAHSSQRAGSNMWTESSHYALTSALNSAAYVYPSVLRAVAAGGNIVLTPIPRLDGGGSINYSLMLAPSATGQLELLAGQSILAQGGPGVSMSGADTPVANPLRPAFLVGELNTAVQPVTNVSLDAVRSSPGNYSLFAFGPNSPLARGLRAGDGTPVRFYAVQGDVAGLKSGGIVDTKSRGYPLLGSLDRWYEAATPVSVRAGRDILAFKGGALHNNTTDVSLIQAGRDILHADFTVAGPGTVVLQAARQFRQDDVASVRSLGGLVRGDTRPGASIAVLAGVGAAGPDYAGFLARYLDAGNLLRAAAGGLDVQPDKVAQTYGGELTLKDWLFAEYGYAGTDADAPAELVRQQRLRDDDLTQPYRSLAEDYRQESELYLVNWLRSYQAYAGGSDDARAALDALAPAQQEIYARQLYFAELKKSGREYNDEDGPRSGSYLRGRRAIASFFPGQDAAGKPLSYEGDFTMYGGAGLHTDFGGSIQLLTPGGRQVVGIEGEAPPSTAGVVTQGAGDIQMYAQDSILLGQSRIMTTFGGHILAWSAQGDINAGRGAKTTVIYTPPRRVYDSVGNVTLAPTVPSTGAGIATLAPIAEVPAGDVDLLAPLGTIDAGEAGIRVSGNVNIAALQVVNAANIQVKGDAVGIPVVAAVNVGALTNASAAASSAAEAAQESVARSRAAARQNLPSIISVQILGFGEEGGSTGALPAQAPARVSATPVRYDADSAIQVLGAGTLAASQVQDLTVAERRKLGL